MLCERCGKDTYKHEICETCKRKIGVECMKSSRKVSKTQRIVICKDCWSDMKKRKIFKTMALVETVS